MKKRRPKKNVAERQRPTVGPWLRRWYALTALYAVFLTLLLWLPDPRALLFAWQPSGEAQGYAHLMTFSLLAFMVEAGRRRKSRRVWFGILVFYAFFTEVVQHFLPIRSFDLADIAQDIAGIALGMLLGTLVSLFSRYSGKAQRSW